MAASTIVSEEQASRLDSDSAELLDINPLKELARTSLIHALNSVNGAKTLVLDPSLAGPLSLVTEVSLLQHHGVDKMFWLESGPLSAVSTNIVYLCRPKIKWVKIIADHIKRHSREGKTHTYTLLLVPRVSTLVSRVLEEEGVLGDVTISSYNLQFIPLADDVLSLENEQAFKEIWVDGDETAVYDSAQALYTLQKLFGIFPRILGKGDSAARLATLLNRQTSQNVNGGPDSTMTISDKFDSLIVLDRKVDMITPLLTQLTYQGLIDEVVGIKNSHVEVPVSLLNAPANPPGPSTSPSASTAASTAPAHALAKEKKRKHHLTAANDPILAELRDLNFAVVGKRLNRIAHRLDEDFKARHKAQSVSQLKDFVGKLGSLQTEHQSLRLHTGLSEIIMPVTRSEVFNKSLEIQQNLLASYDIPGQITAIEDLLAQGADMQVVVRLLCLASITAGGIKSKALDNIKREILQTYGYNFLPLLLSLSSPSLGILLPNPLPPSAPAALVASKYPYVPLRKSLRLIIEGSESLDELENDISFVYSGYSPISIRLVQCIAQKGGVVSNPANVKEKAGTSSGSTNGGGEGDESADRKTAKSTVGGKVQAHPIVGWKGFEDAVGSIPGETVDIMQKGIVGGDVGGPSPVASMPRREQTSTTVVFFLGGCTYTEIAALRWAGRQNQGSSLELLLWAAALDHPILFVSSVLMDLSPCAGSAVSALVVVFGCFLFLLLCRFPDIGRKFLIATTGIVSGSSIVEGIAGVGRGVAGAASDAVVVS
ncbi:Sec1-like protein [Stereum hirsutum FP-91666 SS1]|uniref:Sec1-like protein n=1 Tax=Stereum hirsutum (strain FP-91666) TaxID=721885 RepID=UPI000444A782|nr:Sec1-like protein [Stereum hirsutum FP-91666 SS1]EIM83622.1 Sec1-like protein [Stereum hirsutum FP-91666 SS1]